MTNLKHVKVGWKWLETNHNALIDGINARTISVPAGGGIDIMETPSGALISLSSSGVIARAAAAATSGTGGSPDDLYPFPLGGMDREAVSHLLFRLAHAPNGDIADWQSINVIDTSSGTCLTKTILYWGTPPA
jgi:hypothetical protein